MEMPPKKKPGTENPGRKHMLENFSNLHIACEDLLN